MNYTKIIIPFLFLLTNLSFGQNNTDSIYVHFPLKFNNTPLELKKEYVTNFNQKIKISTFKIFISNFKIDFEDNTNHIEPNSYHLLTTENNKSFTFPITKNSNKKIKRIHFSIGVDSIESVSGALDGALDPTSGMYWSWQSGYINIKLEGTSPSCTTPKKEFTFHIGGYAHPNNAMRNISLAVNINSNTIEIPIDLSKLLNELDLRKTDGIMSPGKKAMDFADLFVKTLSNP